MCQKAHRPRQVSTCPDANTPSPISSPSRAELRSPHLTRWSRPPGRHTSRTRRSPAAAPNLESIMSSLSSTAKGLFSQIPRLRIACRGPVLPLADIIHPGFLKSAAIPKSQVSRSRSKVRAQQHQSDLDRSFAALTQLLSRCRTGPLLRRHTESAVCRPMRIFLATPWAGRKRVPKPAGKLLCEFLSHFELFHTISAAENKMQ